jgi:hypothetical protein
MVQQPTALRSSPALILAAQRPGDRQQEVRLKCGRVKSSYFHLTDKALYSLANGTLANALRSREAKIEEEEHLPQLLAEDKRPAAGQEVAKKGKSSVG